ncbi:MAG: sigma 54-interacting transcriptional regulator [Candidatus Adiutrix sp.]|jgi:psp operon transcriptional activator|nr:sigma 54-interacting transcriptional regulator [Candidatus Adiutrix sp.]
MDAEIWGESEAILEIKSRLSRAAKVNRPVLIIGERGTGKELAASRLHYLSPRWQGPYLTLNCAALNPGLLESELFGHESGAFTGAGRTRPGRFEAADGGTLFLEEISHLSLAAQAKILRVVEYGSFQRLGNAREMKVDVRLVSASNVDLWARAEAGKFRPDLLDRLSFEVITLPPLREREGDIPLLAHLFAARMAQELGLDQIPTFTPAAAEALARHPWPGNVRELKNTVERQVFNLDQDFVLDLKGFVSGRPNFTPDRNLKQPPNAETSSAAGQAPREDPKFPWAEGEFDRRTAAYALGLFQEALKEARHNQREAARLLGLTYHRFRFLHKKFQMRGR